MASLAQNNFGYPQMCYCHLICTSLSNHDRATALPQDVAWRKTLEVDQFPAVRAAKRSSAKKLTGCHWQFLMQVRFTLQLSKFLRRQNVLWLHWCLTWETKVAFTRWRFLPDMPLDLYSSGWPIYGKSRFQSFQNRVKCFVFHRLRCEVKTSIAKKTCILGVVQNKILSSSSKYTSHHTSYISVNFQCLTRKIWPMGYQVSTYSMCLW